MKIFFHFILGLLVASLSVTGLQAVPRTIFLLETEGKPRAIIQPAEEIFKGSRRAPEMPGPAVFIHLVQPGETVASLSKLYRVERERIRKANFLKKQDALDPGLRLIIPD